MIETKATYDFCISIEGIRERDDGTYTLHPVPDLMQMFELNGDFSWSGLDIDVKDSQWKTFLANEDLQEFISSPTGCETRIKFMSGKNSLFPEGFYVFYCDSQGCIIWAIDPSTGKIYSSANDEYVADTLEEFWFHRYIESLLWRCMSWSGSKKLDDLPNFCQKYAQFYLQYPKNANEE